VRHAAPEQLFQLIADAFANGKGSSAVGYNATATGENSLALGYNAKANNAKDVALGADSTTAAAVATTGTTIRGTDYTFAGTAPVSTLSIGSAGNERTLTNLAAGRLSATSTDAVNGSQLFATNQAIEGISGDISDLSDLAVKYDTNPDGTVNYNSVTMGGERAAAQRRHQRHVQQRGDVFPRQLQQSGFRRHRQRLHCRGAGCAVGWRELDRHG
jgi:autotransporter adhesin